ncbi:MAG: sigma 54-interacting transcriptional regulator [Desulfomonilaceae bacterium]|nr:sigma 54-interacting transcriptional regulator [Desulfomonilaceae bacterium]
MSRHRVEHTLTPVEIGMILDSVADGVFTVDGDFIITSFNRAAEEITGVPVGEAIGRPCCEVFRAEICEGECALKQTVRTGKPVVNRAVYILRADGARVPISVSTAILKDAGGEMAGGVETFRDLTLVEALRREVEKSFTFEDMLSNNQRMKEIFSILPDVALSDSTILIEGESGTGKEVLAKAIHKLSSRSDKPLITVNCGAIPDTLLESELFGYKAGAFTDAKRDKPGRFAQADGGTILLDEIGDITPALQVRLLRVLQDKSFEPLGSTKTLSSDARVIAATNKDLRALVEQGDFREDLYYRIRVFRLTLPPLRERKEDVPLLAQHFIDRFNRLKGKDISGLSRESLLAFMDYDWPGNIRELENALEHAFILCHGGLIERHHLPEPLCQAPGSSHGFLTGATLAEIEARIIRETLARNKGKKLATARELGINKTTLWRKIKRLGIEEPDETAG